MKNEFHFKPYEPGSDEGIYSITVDDLPSKYEIQADGDLFMVNEFADHTKRKFIKNAKVFRSLELTKKLQYA